MAITVLAADEYKAQEFDAVLVRDRTVVCVAREFEGENGADDQDGLIRAIPMEKVNHVDADPGTMLSGTEIPDWFYGGGQYGFADVEAFPDLEEHLEDIERETV